MSRDDDNPLAGVAAKAPANAADNPAGRSSGRASGRAFEPRKLRHRVDGDVLRVWDAEHPEPAPYQTPELHAVELLRWLSSRYPAGIWVAATDIQLELYPEFLRERGWPAQPMQTVLRHMKVLTRRREKGMDAGARSVMRRRERRFVQVQYEIPQPAAAVVDIEAARKRA